MQKLVKEKLDLQKKIFYMPKPKSEMFLVLLCVKSTQNIFHRDNINFSFKEKVVGCWSGNLYLALLENNL